MEEHNNNEEHLAAIQKKSYPFLTVVIGTCNSIVKQYDCKTQCHVTVLTWWQLWQCTYVCYVNFMQFLWTHEHHLQFLASSSLSVRSQQWRLQMMTEAAIVIIMSQLQSTQMWSYDRGDMSTAIMKTCQKYPLFSTLVTLTVTEWVVSQEWLAL